MTGCSYWNHYQVDHYFLLGGWVVADLDGLLVVVVTGVDLVDEGASDGRGLDLDLVDVAPVGIEGHQLVAKLQHLRQLVLSFDELGDVVGSDESSRGSGGLGGVVGFGGLGDGSAADD